ncbi:MAG: hypothetical protein KY391_07380 [Actinobacteria bacterium]|nr:hypothetical protein [Actinomycetota bacterium]
MNLSPRAKILVSLGVFVAVVVWIVLLDYGINAGRIHYGVHVGGVDVGGMTLEEAQDVLQQHGEKLRNEPVVLSAEGMNCSFVPDDVGWRPRPKRTAQIARSVGFRGGLTTDLRDRIKAWFTGVEVEWAGSPKSTKTKPLIDDCERQAEALHLVLDRAELRRLVTDAIVTWPRRVFQVPVATAG